jgi:hypothetical protein
MPRLRIRHATASAESDLINSLSERFDPQSGHKSRCAAPLSNPSNVRPRSMVHRGVIHISTPQRCQLAAALGSSNALCQSFAMSDFADCLAECGALSTFPASAVYAGNGHLHRCSGGPAQPTGSHAAASIASNRSKSAIAICRPRSRPETFSEAHRRDTGNLRIGAPTGAQTPGISGGGMRDLHNSAARGARFGTPTASPTGANPPAGE